MRNHLDFLEEHAFKGVKKVSPLGFLPGQPRFSKKVAATLYYPVVEEKEIKDKTLIALGWLTCNILEQDELLALTVLDLVLMGTDASPLKMALLKSNLCKQADSSLDVEMSEVPYILVCKGCKEGNSQAIEKLVDSVLNQAVKEGFQENLIEGAIHQLEMSRTEITGNSAPYGLALYFRSALLKQHGGNPEDGLRIHTLFQRLRKNVQNPRYLPSLIQKYLLENSHFVQIEMNPDAALAKKELEEEKKKLTSIQNSLNEEEIKQILKQSKALTVYQESQKDENLDILPKVTLNDVVKYGKEFPLVEEK